MRIALVTNIPAPYRIPIFNRIGREMGNDFLAIFCARSEPNRQWGINQLEFNHLYLKERFITTKNSFIHCNPDVLKALCRFKPDIVITSGFNPTHIFAWAYTLFTKSKHIPMTDGWRHSESELTICHQILRKVIYRTSSAFIGAGMNSLELFRSYGVKDKHLFMSQLCIDNDLFSKHSDNIDRQYDVMYSGQIIERKIPGFFIEVVKRAKSCLGSLSVLVIGDGPQRDEFLKLLKEHEMKVTYAGFICQQDLPNYYSKAKVLLFTTKNDPWGIVANEALASGTPVITSPFAGVKNDLVINGENGFVLDLDPLLWASKIVELLQDNQMLETMRKKAVASVREFNFDSASQGIISAARHAIARNDMI